MCLRRHELCHAWREVVLLRTLCGLQFLIVSLSPQSCVGVVDVQRSPYFNVVRLLGKVQPPLSLYPVPLLVMPRLQKIVVPGCIGAIHSGPGNPLRFVSDISLFIYFLANDLYFPLAV